MRRSYLILLILLTILFVVWIVFRFVVQPPWVSDLSPFAAELLNLVDMAWGATLIILWGVTWWRQQRPLPKSDAALNAEAQYALSPREFESYVANLFRLKGYEVSLRGGSGDLGVDLELVKGNGRRAIVQCKRYRHTVGPDIVRELFGTMIHERVHHTFLVTTAEISDAAVAWARNKPMTLIDGKSLTQIASELHVRETV